ncbi:MAG: hypothetical protein A3E01_00460 [Gammaproteobacteria bacterium RIFCSPHIGHO2_12_FULL_63_22]|nr:MAG: hypothetical protein A3E01_00460 [Gammaproteobacteria bacterium RIFCSPHIGHO2_12_FULL_63_22]
MAAFASFAFAASPTADAATVTKQLQVTAEIEPFCAINVFDLEFGLYTTANINGGVDLDSIGSIYVICPDAVAFTIALDGGLNSQMNEFACDPGAPVPPRGMVSTTPPNSGNLGYELYSDEARTIGWGCSPETDVAGIGNGVSFDLFPVYGRIPAGAVTLADTYSDTVTVTVTF